MDNNKLAKFIVSLGSLNNYGSTIAQTQKALDLKDTSVLRQDNDDVVIFEDALKGIEAVQKVGFSVEGIIAINKKFDGDSPEQPAKPGHLRNAFYDPDDAIVVVTSADGRGGYIAPDVVTKQDLQDRVDTFLNSTRQENDAWRLFAQLAKLQPFQDGNKRTALIAINAAMDMFSKDDFLIVPMNDLDRMDFTLALMRFYMAESPEQEEQAFQRMISVLPTSKEREFLLRQPIENEPHDEIRDSLKTFRVKEEFRNNKKDKK